MQAVATVAAQRYHRLHVQVQPAPLSGPGAQLVVECIDLAIEHLVPGVQWRDAQRRLQQWRHTGTLQPVEEAPVVVQHIGQRHLVAQVIDADQQQRTPGTGAADQIELAQPFAGGGSGHRQIERRRTAGSGVPGMPGGDRVAEQHQLALAPRLAQLGEAGRDPLFTRQRGGGSPQLQGVPAGEQQECSP